MGAVAAFIWSISLWGTDIMVSMEQLDSDDITYLSASIDGSAELGTADLRVLFVSQNIDVAYQTAGYPIDFVTIDQQRDETYVGGSVSVVQSMTETVQWLGTLGYYKGFSRHQSIWLDEYYKQLWSDREVAGDRYSDPDPSGVSIDLGMRWEYINSNAFLQLSGSYSKVTIAPGYEFMVDGERAGELVQGVDELDVISLSLSSENNLSRRARMKNSLTVSSTTGRDPRFTYLAAVNLAVSTDWIFQLEGIYAREGSEFESTRLKGSLIYSISDQLSVNFTASRYRDNGEIEQANLATDAAPGQTGIRFFTGLSWISESEIHQLSITVGLYENRYDELGLDRRFEPLYRSRDWSFIQLGYQISF